MSTIGTIFSIEEFSTFDGPGIRTTIFLKGCPLKCSWCHNPEGQAFQPEILKNPNNCLHCGRCIPLSEESIDACPRNLIRLSGQRYTAHQLVDRLLKNQDFYASSGGGVTFSGGEPLSQPQFLSECLDLLEGKIHRCLQTSGYCSPDVFKSVLTKLDLVLFDLKVIDPKQAKRYIGVDPAPIYENLDHLSKSEIPFVIRLPLIPGVTDTQENAINIISLLKKHNIHYAEALPYNPFTSSKYTLCSRTFKPDFDAKRLIQTNEDLFKKNDIFIKIL